MLILEPIWLRLPHYRAGHKHACAQRAEAIRAREKK
jgi:hypothetical protein